MHACTGTLLSVSIMSCTAYSGNCTRSGRLSVLLCRYLSMLSSYVPWASNRTRTRSCEELYSSVMRSSSRLSSFDRPCQNTISTGPPAAAMSSASTSQPGSESIGRGKVVGGSVGTVV